MNADILGLLLALDGIRLLREQGIVSGTDAPAPVELLTALDLRTRAGTGAGSGLAVARSPPTEAALHEDHDTLVYFAEMLAEFLPNLAVMAGGGDAGQAADDLDELMVASGPFRLNGFHSRLARLAASSGSSAIDRFAAVIADARRFGRLIGHDAGADAALAAATRPLRRAMVSAGRVLGQHMPADPIAALASAERLVGLAAAGMEDGGVAILILRSLGDEAALDPALAAARLVAASFSGDGADGPDLLFMAAERLRDAMMPRWTLSASLRKVLEDRGIDPERLGDIDAAALARLGMILEGAQRKLVAITLSLPSQADRREFLRDLGRQVRPAAVQASAMVGSDAVVLLAITSERPVASDRQRISSELPRYRFHRNSPIDGRAFEHPWATPGIAATTTGGSGLAETQVRVPVRDPGIDCSGELANFSASAARSRF